MLYSEMDRQTKFVAMSQFISKFDGAEIALVECESIEELMDSLIDSGDWMFTNDGLLFNTWDVYSLEDMHERIVTGEETREAFKAYENALMSAIEWAMDKRRCFNNIESLSCILDYECLAFDAKGQMHQF